MDKKFDFKDITLVPETISSISSRSEINILTDSIHLPLMVSPMDTVIDYTSSIYFWQENMFLKAKNLLNNNSAK
jgi:hypothetical protein